MSYCTPADVYTAFPLFTPNSPSNPSTASVQIWLDEAKAYIRAKFLKRGIDPDNPPVGFNPPVLVLTTDQSNILRYLNMISGIADLGAVLRYVAAQSGTLGIDDRAPVYPLNPKRFEDGRFSQVETGQFDQLFNSSARVLSIFPVTTGSIAGGDQMPWQDGPWADSNWNTMRKHKVF